MSLRSASFGLFGHPRQAHLPGTDPDALPGADGLRAPPHPNALSLGPYAPAGNGADALFGGRVVATTTGFGTAAERTLLDVTGSWNSVKNASATSDGAAAVEFRGFVHVDAALGLASDEAVAVELVGAKRGNVATGGGADTVSLRVAPTDGEWSREFRVATGAGNDQVRISFVDLAGAVAAGDGTFASAEGTTFDGNYGRYSGKRTTVLADLGAGDDLWTMEGLIAADVRAGDGADRVQLGAEAGTVHGDGGDDGVSGGEGADHLAGDEGSDTLSGGAGIDWLAGGDGGDALSGGDGEDTLAGGGGDDTLSGGEGPFDAAVFGGRADGYEVVPSAGLRSATVRDIDPSDGDEGTDTLDGIERIEFGDRAIDLPAIRAGVPGLVFRAGVDGRYALWVTDGTPEGTQPVADLESGEPSGSGGAYWWLALGDGRALVWTGNGYAGTKLWATDGTAAGTALVASVPPGATNTQQQIGYAYGPVALGEGRALFASPTGEGDAVEFRVTDGTAAGTGPLAGFETVDGHHVRSRALVSLGDGRALFAASEEYSSSDLWATDGTAAGTAKIADLALDGHYEYYYEFEPLGDGRTLFRASDGMHGEELWVSDGTAAGTRMVADIDPRRYSDSSSPHSSYPSRFVALGDGRALFSADDGTHGRELWVSDGTAAGTRMVADLDPRLSSYGYPEWGDPAGFALLGDGRAVFSADDGRTGEELWITDGMPEGTSLVRDLHPGGRDEWGYWDTSSSPADFAPLGDGRVVFSATDGKNGYELWVTDGTMGRTSLVKDLDPDSTGSYFHRDGPTWLTPLPDGRVVFTASDGVRGAALWVTDGTAAGTSILKGTYTDSSSSYGDEGPHLFTPVVGGVSGADPFG